MSGCSICDGAVYAKGLCAAHYKRLQRYGDAKAERPLGPGKTEVRKYLETTGEWDNIAQRSRAKYLLSLTRLHRMLGWYWDYEPETMRVNDAIAVARALAFDNQRDEINYSMLEREVANIWDIDDDAALEKRLKALAGDNSCRR